MIRWADKCHQLHYMTEQAIRVSQHVPAPHEKEDQMARRHPLLFHGRLHEIAAHNRNKVKIDSSPLANPSRQSFLRISGNPFWHRNRATVTVRCRNITIRPDYGRGTAFTRWKAVPPASPPATNSVTAWSCQVSGCSRKRHSQGHRHLCRDHTGRRRLRIFPKRISAQCLTGYLLWRLHKFRRPVFAGTLAGVPDSGDHIN